MIINKIDVGKLILKENRCDYKTSQHRFLINLDMVSSVLVDHWVNNDQRTPYIKKKNSVHTINYKPIIRMNVATKLIAMFVTIFFTK